MTSDRARVSYDPSRRYHGVVAQQGRVSLEADWNEAQAISGEQLEARTLDLIGPAASPDDGYRIDAIRDDEGAATGDLRVRPGTLYLGGQRVTAVRELRYGDQPDWADHRGDALWRESAIPDQPHELIYLLAREQEVSAVEDPVLRDVALGGPDTAQRLRIVQRVIRQPTAARTWEDAWAQLIEQQWGPRGFRLSRPSRRLEPAARLQVTGRLADGEEQSAAQGSYLGPNNQLLRVQIARVGDDGVPVLVWGFDNASFLYRLISSRTGPDSRTTLRLATPPVDSHHQPAEDQAVEVLRSAAELGGPDFIAAATGLVVKVAAAYDPDSRELAVAAELPQEYRREPDQGPPLYLRVWQGELRCEPGKEHELGRTGLRVRLTEAEDGRGYPVGAYWTLALRPAIGPGSPGVVYPERILHQPQPPDGPRQWLTPLAYVRWHPRAPEAEDCVLRFDSLAREERSGGSCTVRLRPEDVGGGWALQDMIDAYASADRAATVCLEPGAYTLSRPLRIGPQHGRLTIRAARPGVVLRSEPESAARFMLGLVNAREANGLCLQGLEIHAAHAMFVLEPDLYLHQPERARMVLAAHRHRAVSIGLHVTRCTGLAVRDCRFVLSPPASREPGHAGSPPDAGPPGPPPESGRPPRPPSADLFGVGILAAEELRGLRVEQCTFTVSEPIGHARSRPHAGEAADGQHHVALGFVQVPSAIAESLPAGETEPAEQRGSASVPLLDDAVLDDNLFERLTAPVVAMGQLGAIRAGHNTVRDCHAGFWLVAQQASYVLTLLDRLVNQVGEAYRDLVKAHLAVLGEPLLYHTTVLARTLPRELSDDLDAAAEARRLKPPSAADERQASELMHQLSGSDTREEPGTGAAQRDNNRLRGFLETFGRVRGTRRQSAEVAVPPEAALRCVLDVAGNVLACGAAPGLVVLNTAPESAASLVLTGNQVRSRPQPGAAACLYLLEACAAAANIIVNEEPEHELAASLIVRPHRRPGSHQTAVTGNVLVGRAHLPRRPDDLPGWESLNSVTRS